MNHTSKTVFALTIVSLIFFVVGSARADWDPGDPYKMHFPQLPDPNGWDVQAEYPYLADDWLCTQSGPVNEIHFWCSWKEDLPADINSIEVGIFDIGILC